MAKNAGVRAIAKEEKRLEKERKRQVELANKMLIPVSKKTSETLGLIAFDPNGVFRLIENRWMRVFKVSGNLKALASVATRLSGRIRIVWHLGEDGGRATCHMILMENGEIYEEVRQLMSKDEDLIKEAVSITPLNVDEVMNHISGEFGLNIRFSYRLEDTNKVSNTKFKELFEEYEDFVDSLRITEDMSDEDVVFNSLAYWVIQWKYPFELFYTIALFEEENKGAIDNREQISLLCADLSIQRPHGTISTHSRFIKTRNNMVKRIMYNTEKMSDDVDFDTFTLQEYIYLKAQMMQNYCADAEKQYYLKDWFAEETTISEWADFLREYDIFSIHQEKEWTNKRIKTVRELIKKMTVK